MDGSENYVKGPCTSKKKQSINFDDLKQKASDLLNNALNDPSCQWVVLGDEERQMIKNRCQTLFKWFCYLPLSSLSDHTAVSGVNYEENSLDEPCFELNASKYVVERYIEKGTVDFEREFGMEIDQLIISLLFGIWEDQNKSNVNFAPLCEALQMDKSTYNMVKQFLRGEENGHKTAKDLIEVSEWPLNVDWSSIKFSEEEWFEEDFYEFDRIVREEAARQWEVQKLFPQGESEAVALLLQPGQLCLARADRDDALNLSEARVLNRTSTLVYQLAFLENVSTEDVNPVDIAVPSLPLYDPDVKRTNYIGLRVTAMVKSPYCDDEAIWCTGTIGNAPNLTHNKEFLVHLNLFYNTLNFFDDGFDLYVKAPFDSCDVEARTAAKIDKGSVYQLIQQNPERRRFIQKYFEKYPDWPLVRMKKPAPPERPAQAIMAYDRHHHRTNTYVVHVDRSMCVLRFPTKTSVPGANCFEYPCPYNHSHNDELLFRGSPRLHAVTLENFGNNNMSARRMAKNRSQFDVVQPDRSVPEKTKPTARKSSISLPRIDGGTPYLQSQYENGGMNKMDPREIEQRKRRENLYKVVPRNSIGQLSSRCQTYHDECSSECLHGLDCDPYDPKFQTCSPLHIPMMCGWQRIMYLYQLPGKHKGGDKRILYRAPCGRSLTSMDFIAKFLRESDSELTIDLFTFDPLVDTHTFVEVPENSVKSADYAKGLEQMPIPAVNMIDDEEPPQIFYGARRFPYNDQVDVSTISRDFCSGCTCEDDCSNPAQCECQQLTRSNVMRLANSFRPKEFGYRNRMLQGITISGIFECNDNCGCQRKRCFNRVVQHPIKYPIQIYKTAQSGWGVRALTDIPKGAFIANYVGALLTDSIADTLKKGEDEYFADLDLNDARDLKKMFFFRNYGSLFLIFILLKFLNHSCDPNVYVQHVLVDTHDLRLPWSAFFSKRKIKAGETDCVNASYNIGVADSLSALRYQRISPIEHILLRPDTYIGSTAVVEDMPRWIFDRVSKRMNRLCVSYPPGLLKIFDEILVNAADNKQRDHTMKEIRIIVDKFVNYCSLILFLFSYYAFFNF
uniref:C3H1-type domain-containing protein n=1 Tax=Heterorhabditis bacteriophora TaxID=37862 RepID=A0A1I7XH15_HETBA